MIIFLSCLFICSDNILVIKDFIYLQHEEQS